MIEPLNNTVEFPAMRGGVKLCQLDFVDLYMSLYEDLPSYYQVFNFGTHVMQQMDLPPEYHNDIVILRTRLEEALRDTNEVGITYDGMRLRASKATTTRDQTWVAMRRIMQRPPAINDLGFTLPVTESLKQLGLRDGLILICGSTGQGKTTTASALLYEYLVSYGGVAFTIEDPVEYQIDGRQGKSGLCYQVEVKEENDWASWLKRSLRWHPRYIMVGEVRTPEAANQLLRAATSGHLVITTMHAGSIEEGLEGLLHLAEQAIGEHAPLLLATGLTGVLHQSFMPHSVEARLYATEAGNLGDPVRALIRERHIGQMSTFVDQQTIRRSQNLRPNPFQEKRKVGT